MLIKWERFKKITIPINKDIYKILQSFFIISLAMLKSQKNCSKL